MVTFIHPAIVHLMMIFFAVSYHIHEPVFRVGISHQFWFRLRFVICMYLPKEDGSRNN